LVGAETSKTIAAVHSQCPLWANSGHSAPQNMVPYSITSSARLSSVGVRFLLPPPQSARHQ